MNFIPAAPVDAFPVVIVGNTGPTGPLGGPTGSTGIVGPTGPAGGPTGPTGPTGLTGAGATGPTGPQGLLGPSGMAGPTGSQGVLGPTGPQGLQGLPGASGSAGVTGPIGAQGGLGPTGPQGVQGVQGSPGTIGPAGTVGPTGSTGPTGAVGRDSTVPGPTGPLGLTGATGPVGPAATGGTGPAGPTGITGPIGQAFTGPTGPAGPTGFPGNIGSVGPTGFTGNTGPAGTAAATGATGPVGGAGPTGSTGPAGTAAATGATGPQGLVGPTGATGPQGANSTVPGPSGPPGNLGPTGPQGAAGVTGATGPQGSQGQIGPTGPSGIQGIPGQTGLTGAVGPTGSTGLQGAQGNAGQTGPQGIVGPTGAQGVQGVQGIQGIQGQTGPQGVQGSIGPIGATGPSGAQGAVGAIGATGPTGGQGTAGTPGTPGAVGATGSTGSTGPTGTQGTAGTPGTPGAAGATGPTGAQGTAGTPGTSGTAGSTGPTGAQGTAGTPGIVGPTGPVGLTGPSGSTGAPGAAAATGATGPQGTVGVTGPTGQQGTASTIPGPPGSVGPTGDTGPLGGLGPTGPTGAGATGPTGTRGGSINLLDFTFSTSVMAPPGNAQLRCNANQITATKLYFDDRTVSGNDTTIALRLVDEHFEISVQDQTTSGNYQVYNATGPTVDRGGYLEVPVVWVSGGGAIASMQVVLVALRYHGEPGVTGPTGDPGAQGSIGPVGPGGAPGPAGPAGPGGIQGPTGPAGPEGQQGVPGASSNTLDYSYSDNTSPPPGSGQIRFDTADQTLATKLYIHDLTSPGNDATVILNSVDATYELFIQDKDNSARYQNYNVVGDSISQGTYFEIPIAWLEGGTALPAGQRVFVMLLHRGAVGPTGPQGNAGAQGPVGPTGGQGSPGAPGSTGSQGSQGVPGTPGAAGPTGPQGAQGFQGTVGPTGSTGAQGGAGTTGPTGAQGAVGGAGGIGPAGATGPTGSQGTQGTSGTPGGAGPAGATGPTGAASTALGPTGATGAVGPTGGGGSSITIADTPPAGAHGSLWWESDTNILWIYYNDGTSSQWVQANGGAQPDVYVKLAGDTMIGDLSVKKASPLIYLNRTVAGGHAMFAGQSNDVTRWLMAMPNSDAESSGNAGSNFSLGRFSDAGTFVDWPLQISRATGQITTLAPILPQTAWTATQQLAARQVVYAAPFDAMGWSNILINGGMEVAQETTGGTIAVAAAVYPADCWIVFNSSSASINGTQSLYQSPNIGGLQKMLMIQAPTALGAPAAANFIITQQNIEGWRVNRLNWGWTNARPLTICFLIAASATGPLTGALTIRAGANRTYVAPFTCAGGAVQEWKTITIPGDTKNIWPNGNQSALTIGFTFYAGTNWYATPNTWVDGNLLAASGISNFFPTNNAYVWITGVGAYVGSVAPPDQHQYVNSMRTYDEELLLAKRYYQKIGGSRASAGVLFPATAGVVNDSGRFWFPYPVEMRAEPTTTQVGTWNTANVTAGSIQYYPTTAGCYVLWTIPAIGSSCIYTNDVNAFLALNARL
ncbi:MAG TPA: hypothetical protein VF077_05410 [Nitrospiraceae bacterium]